MKGKIAGILILICVIIGAIFYKYNFADQPEALNKPSVVKGSVGGEKTGFMDDAEVQKILKNEYGLTVDYAKVGSIDMVKGDIKGQDFLFPSSQIALEIFKTVHPEQKVKSDTVFNSPIVIYSWDSVTDALEKQGIVQKKSEAYYIVDFPKLIRMITEGKKWSDIGLNLYGSMTITTTDPQKSNSGNEFMGLLANILNGGEVVETASIPKVMPKIQAFYAKLGFLEGSSADLFEQYLRTGIGAKPMIVGYENQMVEFANKHPKDWNKVKEKIRILYPTPTVWSEHPVISLNERSAPLIKALKDPKVQKIAWEKYGFRTGLIGVENDPKVLNIVGIPAEINQVIPLPKAPVMEKMLSELK